MPTPTPLVMRFGALGDMVLLIPMLKALAARYGQPCDLVSAGPWTVPLMQRVPACGSIRILTSRRTPYYLNRSQWQLVDWLRQRPRGPAYVFEPDLKPLRLLDRGGVGPEWICSMRDLPRLPGEHIASHALRLARQTPVALQGMRADPVIPATVPDCKPVLSEADRADCATWLEHHRLTGRPLVLLQPGNKKTMKGGSRQRPSNVKYWAEANWAEVIAGVRRRRSDAQIIICGAPSERPLAEDIVALVPQANGSVRIATDDLPIPRLLALQERAHSLISVDTGPAHTAAAMGCPAVVLFSNRLECAADLYAPLSTSAPVSILQAAAESAAGLASITPQAVLDAWQALGGIMG